MERKAISGVVAAIIIAVLVGVGASAYYLGVVLPMGQTTQGTMSTVPQGSSASTTTTTTMQTMMPSVSQSSASSTTTMQTMMPSVSQSSAKSSSDRAVQLSIVAGRISHSLSGRPVTAACGPTMPATSASYLQVTNTGPGTASVVRILFNYVDMATESGAPSEACVVGPGATVYITVTGIGEDMAIGGEPFSVSLGLSNGGFVSFSGAFG